MMGRPLLASGVTGRFHVGPLNGHARRPSVRIRGDNAFANNVKRQPKASDKLTKGGSSLEKPLEKIQRKKADND